jgi:hypothetical protein
MRAILVVLFLMQIFSCGKITRSDNNKDSKPGTPDQSIPEPDVTDPVISESNYLNKIIIDSTVLDAIKDNLAAHSPMRAGYIFGTIKNNTAHIEYFLYDSEAEHSGGSYAPSADINSPIALLESLPGKDDDSRVSFLGMILSSPGAISYVFGPNESHIDNFFSRNLKINIYIYAVVTMGNETMQEIKAHERKLSDNAKISFYVKKRNEAIKPSTNVEISLSNPDDYKEMNSYIAITSHILNAENKLSLSTLGFTDKKFDSTTFEYRLNFGDNPDIKVTFDKNYPKTPPTLQCIPRAQGKDLTPTASLEAKNWQPDHFYSKNFVSFFEKFITKHCPLKS